MTDERIHKAMYLLASAGFALSGEPPHLAWACNDAERALALMLALYDEQRKAKAAETKVAA